MVSKSGRVSRNSCLDPTPVHVDRLVGFADGLFHSCINLAITAVKANIIRVTWPGPLWVSMLYIGNNLVVPEKFIFTPLTQSVDRG